VRRNDLEYKPWLACFHVVSDYSLRVPSLRSRKTEKNARGGRLPDERSGMYNPFMIADSQKCLLWTG
jgi:hypothetical protein